MEIVRFKKEHFKKLKLREWDKKFSLPLMTDDMLGYWEEHPLCFTFLKGDEVVACTGSDNLYSGIHEIWLFPCDDMHKFTFSFSRKMRKFIDETAKKESVWRVHTYAPDDEFHNRWLKFLGFECEGLLRKFAYDGTDRNIWSRIYEGVECTSK